MGLCKCPKKKVTTQFCFEHRVNVCEHCLVSNHPKVSYLSFVFLMLCDVYFTGLLSTISRNSCTWNDMLCNRFYARHDAF